MSLEIIGAVLWSLNTFVLYGIAGLLTGVVILNWLHWAVLPRTVVLCSWFTVVGLAVMWLCFHLYYLWTHNPRDIGLQVIARIGQFVPIYVCALIVLFMYPRREKS